MTPHHSRVLAFDPGLALCGWALVEDATAIDYGVIATFPRLPDGTENPDSVRLVELRTDITYLLQTHKPDFVAYERPVFTRANTNAGRVQQAVGAMLIACAECGYPNPLPMSASSVKAYAAGDGGADKQAVTAAVLDYYGISHNEGTRDDAYDALAGAIAALALITQAA